MHILRGIGISPSFPASFTKGNNFCDSLLAFLDVIAFSKFGLLLQVRISFKESGSGGVCGGGDVWGEWGSKCVRGGGGGGGGVGGGGCKVFPSF